MQFSRAFWMTALGAVVFSALMIGCGGKKEDEDDDIPRKKSRGGAAAVSVASLKPVKATKYGVLKGKVTWQGDPPATDSLTESLRKEIAGNTDHTYCMKGRLPSDPADFKSDIKPYETTEQEFRIGKNVGLGNVFVWIQPEAGYYFEVPKDQLEAIDKEVVLTQPHCSFLPHCVVVFPSYYKDGAQVKTGQKLFVENDARVTHNSKIKGGPRNGESNQTLQPRSVQSQPHRLASLASRRRPKPSLWTDSGSNPSPWSATSTRAKSSARRAKKTIR